MAIKGVAVAMVVAIAVVIVAIMAAAVVAVAMAREDRTLEAMMKETDISKTTKTIIITTMTTDEVSIATASPSPTRSTARLAPSTCALAAAPTANRLSKVTPIQKAAASRTPE